MPILHPAQPRLPAHLKSEQDVLAALRTLPPESHVFARLGILDPESNRDRELDFLVLHPDLGLVIVEVKGKGVEPRGDHWIRRQDGIEKPLEEAPGEQLQAQQWALVNFLQKEAPGFIPQVTRVLALPELPLGENQDLGPDLPACRILTRTKLVHPFEALRQAVSGGPGALNERRATRGNGGGKRSGAHGRTRTCGLRFRSSAGAVRRCRLISAENGSLQA